VVIYFAKPEVFKFNFSRPILGENAVIIILLAFLAIANLIISFFLSERFLKEAIEKQSVELVQRAMIVGLALCESISLFGLVLAFVFDYQYFFAWFAVGILGMILHFPKRQNIHDASFRKFV
jgi:MFS family permease